MNAFDVMLAEALAAMGDTNAANWAVVQKAVPHLIQMLRAPDLDQVEAGVRFQGLACAWSIPCCGVLGAAH